MKGQTSVRLGWQCAWSSIGKVARIVDGSGCAPAVVFCTIALLSACLSRAVAQEITVTTAVPEGATPVATPDAAKAGHPNPKPGDQPAGGDQPGGDKKPDGEKKPDDKSGDDKSKDKKSDEAQPVKRPATPAKPADPAELKVKPDENGLVTFNFKGQPWQEVLEWLADISHLSLDWQEVPGGYLDLTTRRKYSVDEARDLINSILLTKGYTLLRNGEVLIVSSLKNLDVSLIPVVLPKDLDKCGTFELVRTFFDLDRLQAEPMAEELKPLLSPVGKEHINSLKTTNRLDMIETAGNLRRIRDIIGNEQGDSGKAHQLREFPLHHARVDDVLATLKQLLGIQPDKGPSAPMNSQELQQQMQQQQQMMQQMQQQAQQNGGKGAAPKPQQEEKIYLAINRRENSIMALATPDKLAVIDQAVNLLDVPTDANSPMNGLQRVQIYRLVAADPTPIVNVLKDMGNLDPSTRLEVDNVNKAIIVDGPLVDHFTVKSLIDKLDGSARKFEVIQLRKLDADYVAGSIEFLMRGPNKDTNRSRIYYDPWGGSRQQQDSNKDGGFQVEADTKNNRLLLHANQIELDEIYALMKKLGEDPFVGFQSDNLHIIRSAPGRDTDKLLERLKRIWPNVSPNPLELNIEPQDQPAGDAAKPDSSAAAAEKHGDKSNKADDSSDEKTPPAESPEKKTDKKKSTTPPPTATAASPSEPSPRGEGRVRGSYFTADTDSAQSSDDKSSGDKSEPAAPRWRSGQRHGTDNTSTTVDPQGPPAPPPISITRGPEGLIITSRDQASLDQFMKLIDELSPADAHYHMFNLKHADAKDVAILLETIFQDAGAKKDNTNSRVFYIFDEPPAKPEERNRLSKKEPLRFIADPVTNSLMVKGADDEQLAQIQSLIEYYDRATPPDSPLIRHTQMVPIKYAKAQAVADVLKDVYRDLLSPNDKALASNQPPQQKSQPLFSYFDADNGGSSSKTPTDGLKFKGLLSIGVDATSNTLIVSAPQFLMTGVLEMIHKLDESTKPVEPTTRVVNLGGMSTDPVLMEALKAIADPSAAKASATGAEAKARRDQDQKNRNNRNGQGNGNGGFNNGGGFGAGQNNR